MEKEKRMSTVVSMIVMATIVAGTVCLATNQNYKKNERVNTIGENLSVIVQEEKGEEIKLDDKLVKNLRTKFDFNKMTTIQNIYENIGVSADNMSNELKLELAWNNIAFENKNGEWDKTKVFNVGTEKSYATISQEEMKKSLESLFGTNVKYTDATFENNETQPFWTCRNTKGTVKYQNNKYTSNFVEGGGAGYPYIDEHIKKVIKYDDKIEIYVVTAFCTVNEENATEADILIHSDYNKATKKIENLVDHYNGKFEGADTEEKFDLAFINKYEEKLHTYKYTFNLDNKTGGYNFYRLESM